MRHFNCPVSPKLQLPETKYCTDKCVIHPKRILLVYALQHFDKGKLFANADQKSNYSNPPTNYKFHFNS